MKKLRHCHPMYTTFSEILPMDVGLARWRNGFGVGLAIKRSPVHLQSPGQKARLCSDYGEVLHRPLCPDHRPA